MDTSLHPLVPNCPHTKERVRCREILKREERERERERRERKGCKWEGLLSGGLGERTSSREELLLLQAEEKVSFLSVCKVKSVSLQTCDMRRA